MRIHTLALAALVLSLPVVAQGTFRLDRNGNGTLGAATRWTISGAQPGRFALYMVSLNGGPTPLAPFGDSRFLRVGLELSALWQSTRVPASGRAVFNLGPLPNLASLNGTVLHNQCLTLPGTNRTIGQISNNALLQTAQAGKPVRLPSSLGTPRSIAFASIDPRLGASRSDVVLPGGLRGDPTQGGGLASSEIYNYDTMSFRPGPNLVAARVLPVVVPLTDGRVLIAGGLDAQLNPLRTCEIYDARAGRSTPTGSMTTPRIGHAGVRLADGRVMVYGGTASSNGLAILTQSLKSTEIYDPVTGRWTRGRDGRDFLLLPELTLLRSGQVLMSGGFRITKFIIGIPQGSTNRSNVWTNGTWSTAGAMRASRIDLPGSAVRMNDGRVLRAGGVGVTAAFAVTVLASAEVYNPASRSWAAVQGIGAQRGAASMTVMGNGRVVMAGGGKGDLNGIVASPAVQEFNPASNTWRSLQNLNTARFGHTAIRTKEDLLLVFGGNTTLSTTSNSVETIRN